MIYDHVIIGAGLSGLLKAESLLNSASLGSNQKVFLIDSNPADMTCRTFCSWRLHSDLQHPHKDIVTHRYTRFRVIENDSTANKTPPSKLSQSLDPFIYERIPGDLFYKSMHEKIFRDSRFQLLMASVQSVEELKDHVIIETESGQKILALQVWNSLSQGKPDMIQHFFGFEIETENDFFDQNLVDLMDFRIDQKNEVRFVYHLPFSKRVGLVEFTIFSNNILTTAEYETELREYLSRVFNLEEYKVLRVESGAIPMTLDPWPKFSSPMGFGRISPIGAASGKIKASTGYSFFRNQSAERGSQRQGYFQWRFRVYDTLLIGIMNSNGQEISKIFPTLFARNSSDVLFRFLNEETKFNEELRIFFKLPWKNFLLQLILNYLFFFITIILLLFNGLATHLLPQQNLDWLIWPLPIAGLLTLGITHGSLDHLLNQRISKLKFYFGYLFGLAFFLGLWLISPLLALLGFLILSGDHFGENQFLRALKISGNQGKLRALTFAWGLSVSLIAPLFHWNEAKPLLQTLLRDSQFGESLSSSSAAVIGWFFAALALASAWIIARYEKKALNRSLPGAISSLVLVLTFWALPLLPGFLTFFCFWHSWDSIHQQKKSMGLTMKSYFLKAAPFSLLATLGLVGSVYFFDRIENIEAYLFLLLGALTVSHSVVMKRFYEF